MLRRSDLQAEAQRLLLIATLTLTALCLSLIARPLKARSADGDEQLYTEQLLLALSDVKPNLDSIQYYLPLASHNDPYDPTWGIVGDAANNLASDADLLSTLTPPAADAAQHAALVASLQAAADAANTAAAALSSGDDASGAAALIALNDALVRYKQARVLLPGLEPQPPLSVPTRALPDSTLQDGDGSSPGAPAALGTRVATATGWSIAVSSVDADAWPRLQTANALNEPPSARQRLLLVTVDVTNNGSSAGMLRYADFAVRGASGRVYYPFSPDASCGVVPAQLDAQLAPGAGAQGSVCFRIPAGETDLELVTDIRLPAADARYLALQCRR